MSLTALGLPTNIHFCAKNSKKKCVYVSVNQKSLSLEPKNSFTVSSDPVQDEGLALQLSSQPRVFQGFRVAALELCHKTDFAELFLWIGVKAVRYGLKKKRTKKKFYSSPAAAKCHLNPWKQFFFLLVRLCKKTKISLQILWKSLKEIVSFRNRCGGVRMPK